MPLAKALKSWKGRLGHIRAGTTFNCPPGYFEDLKKKGRVVYANPEDDPANKPKQPGPSDNRDKGEAPNKAGKDQAASGSAPNRSETPAGGQKGTESRRGGGKVLTSRSLRRDLRSRAKTSSASEGGETKTTPPPEDPADE